MYTHPIYHPAGNYPDVVLERVATRSKNEGFLRSRLPPLSEQDVAYIKGTYDFFALNHYSAYMVKDVLEPPPGDPSGDADRHVEAFRNSLWVGSNVFWLKVHRSFNYILFAETATLRRWFLKRLGKLCCG